MAKNLGAVAKDVAARELLEESERYAIAKVTGNLAGMCDRTGQIKWQVEDARGRFAFLSGKFSRYFTAPELAAMRDRDTELAALWDSLERAYQFALEVNDAVKARQKTKPTE